MPIGKGERTDTRQRREFQRLGKGLGFGTGNGLTFDDDTDSLSVDITPDTGGILTFSGGALTTQYITTSGAVGSVTVTIATNLDLIENVGRNYTVSAIDSVSILAGGTSAVFGWTDGSDTFQLLCDSTRARVEGLFGSFEVGASSMTMYGNGSTVTMSDAIGVQVFAAQSGTSGLPVLVKGGSPSVGTNVDSGIVTISGGQPRGTGTTQVLIQCLNNAGTVLSRINANLTGLGFFGATPIARPGTYTIVTAPAVATALNLATATVAYAGIGTASLVDLNALRVDVVNIAAVLRQLIKHLGDTGGLGLVDETAY